MKQQKHLNNLIPSMRSNANEAVMTTSILTKQLLRNSMLVMSLFVTFFLSACGSDSGAPNQARPNDSNGNAANSNYTGVAPATADVQSFKLNVWDNLVTQDKCGSCHNSSTGNHCLLYTSPSPRD